jgi:hypothetical protein
VAGDRPPWRGPSHPPAGAATSMVIWPAGGPYASCCRSRRHLSAAYYVMYGGTAMPPPIMMASDRRPPPGSRRVVWLGVIGGRTPPAGLHPASMVGYHRPWGLLGASHPAWWRVYHPMMHHGIMPPGPGSIGSPLGGQPVGRHAGVDSMKARMRRRSSPPPTIMDRWVTHRPYIACMCTMRSHPTLYTGRHCRRP